MSTLTLLRSGVGAKASLSNEIACFFDEKCTAYYEFFAGALGMYFSFYNGKYEEEHINELSKDIAVLYYALAKEGIQDKVSRTLLGVEKSDDVNIAKSKFKKAENKLRGKGPLDLEQLSDRELIDIAVNTFIVYSQSFNFSGKGYSGIQSNDKYKTEIENNIRNAVDRLKTHPDVTCKNAMDLLKDKGITDNPENQLFLDPPYIGLYRHSSSDYLCEMPTLFDHIRMCELLKEAKAAVVLCGYRPEQSDIPTAYDAFLGGKYKCYLISEMKNNCEVMTKGGKRRQVKEFVWSNREPAGLAKYYFSLSDYKEKLTPAEYWERIKDLCISQKIPQKQIDEYSDTFKKLYDEDLF